jgi:hypothetical protein
MAHSTSIKDSEGATQDITQVRNYTPEAGQPADLHPQTLQRLESLARTYQAAGMLPEEARERALNELREAENKASSRSL